MHRYHFIKLYKNTRKTISWHYPFKSIFTAIIVSPKSWHPLLRSEGASLSAINKSWRGAGGNLQRDAAQLLIFGPIPAKAKMLGLLSIYKFSLVSHVLGGGVANFSLNSFYSAVHVTNTILYLCAKGRSAINVKMLLFSCCHLSVYSTGGQTL